MPPDPTPAPDASAPCDGDLRSLWPDAPWRDIPAADLAPALAVPSMLSDREAQLYHWLGRRARGAGATIDLGAFAGGSAARLLSGLALSGNRYHLHAYDRFTAKPSTRARHLTRHGVPHAEDCDILPLATAHLSPWAPHVTLHRGDIAQAEWPGNPVEIIAIDAAKSPGLADHVAAQFFPALVPGVSVVIHQDFLHASQPWLAVQMARLAPAFATLGRVAADCVAFLNIAPVTPDMLTEARTDGMDDSALIHATRAAADHFAALAPRPRFRAMIARIKANPGVRIAWKMRPPAG